MSVAVKSEVTLFAPYFNFGQRVHIDSDRDLVGVVTAFCWRDSDSHSVEVSWIHNGVSHNAWFHPSRLKAIF